MCLTGTPGFIIGKSASNRITGQAVFPVQPHNVSSAAFNKAPGKNVDMQGPYSQWGGKGMEGS